MLCGVCRRQVPRKAAFCTNCGAVVRKREAAEIPLDLVLGDGSRIPVSETVTIGRAPDNTIQLADASVSRHHARIVPDGGSPRIEDVGSSAGTLLDGRKVRAAPLKDGAKIRLGNVDLDIARRPDDDSGAGKTIVVKVGATVLMSALGKAEVQNATGYGFRPRVRSGWAMKRLPASEGERRWVLHDRRSGNFVRMKADEAALFELLDGKHSLIELMAESERRIGSRGAGTVASLLADLGEKGFLVGVDRDGTDGEPPKSRMQRLFTPRDFAVGWAGPMFERVYRRGGWILFTRASYALMTAICLGGIATWIYLVAGRYGTPFVVAKKVGLGGLVFMGGRFVMVAFHELAHGLTVCSFGRRVPRAGIKLMMVFPYAFVDTSEAWFEPRPRRLAISGAGPVSDFTIGGLFSLLALVIGNGTIRDIFFNLALAAYIGGLFNLNPFLERDGYHMAVDVLREPGLRKRARAWMNAKLKGLKPEGEASRWLKIYAVSSTIWLLSGLIFAIIGTHRFYPVLVKLAPREAVWAGFAVLYLLALLPVFLVIGRPLAQRRKAALPEPDDVGG